jgi:hypothetical protein
LPSPRLIPTSRTTAPGFTIAPVITRGRPTAATRMSARHVSAPPRCLGRSRASRRPAPRPRLAGQSDSRLVAEGKPLSPLDAAKAAALGYTASPNPKLLTVE